MASAVGRVKRRAWWAWALAGVAVPLMVLVAFTFAITGVQQSSSPSQPAVTRVADIPPAYLALYQSAAAAEGIDWTILAGIGKVETDHGRSTAPGVTTGTNQYGCCAGPMQICVIDGCPGTGPRALTPAEARGTWTGIATDGNGDGVKDPWDPADAIPAAAKLLKQNGAPGDYHQAILAYNNAEWYVAEVMSWADKYRTATPTTTTIAIPDGIRGRILTEAESTLSIHTHYDRYQQPGPLTDDPTPPPPDRTDCSQWVRAVYLRAGAPDPGTDTFSQFAKGTVVTTPQPGDLMFTQDLGHVELYVGNGKTYGHGTPPIDSANVDDFPGHIFVRALPEGA